MLSTLISSLASYFSSKYFLVSSVLPMAAFAFFNAATGYAFVEAWRDWVVATFFGEDSTATRTTFITTSIVIGIVAAAYVLSALTNYLRGLLEGKWPEGLRTLFLSGQMSKRQELLDRIDRARRAQIDLESAKTSWINQLKDARTAGGRTKTNTFTKSDATAVEASVKTFHRKRANQELIDAGEIKAAVDRLELFLRKHDADLADTDDRRLLGNLQQDIVTAIREATDHAKSEHLRLHNVLTASFGADQIAPTMMGNVANTAQAYAVRRYDCNLALFWNVLQRVVQKDEEAFTALLESKAQLDFLVASCWLTTAYWITWSVISGLEGYSVGLFVALAVLGPLGSYFWYRAATEHYRSFVDVMTTSLDLFRLKLLTTLSFARPADVTDERQLWDHLHRLASFENDPVNLKYDKANS